LRRTKDEREFRNLVALRRLGVPCPAPLAVARVRSGLLVCETRLLMEFVADATPLSRVLIEQTVPRDAVLDRLVDFLRLLNARGVVHRDLHWDNLLVRPAADGPAFLLIDALHVRLVPPPAGAAFAPTVEWLVAFMLHQSAPREIVDALLDRLAASDLPALPDRQALLDRARRTAALLRQAAR
jgi:RIO-like serine/threonine protein kinase